MANNEVLLFSGGLDSLIAWYYLGKPTTVYVPLGHRYEEQERRAIKRVEDMTGMKTIITERLSLGAFEEPDANIPLRNSFLIHMAALYGDKIWIALQKGELSVPDRTPEFISEITTLLRRLKHPGVIVNSPFWDITKTQMVSWYKSSGYPIDVLLATTSCYTGEKCGQCSACFRRWVALYLNGIEEKYEVDPWTTTLARVYVNRAKHHFYDEQRCKEILMAMTFKCGFDAVWGLSEDWKVIEELT